MFRSSLQLSDLGKGGWAVFSTPESYFPPSPLGVLMVIEGDRRARAEKFIEALRARDPFFVGHLREINFAKGVSWLRFSVFERDDYRCVKCTRAVTWDGPGAGQLHEKVTRGQGGLRSMGNCECLCKDCHTGARGEHGFAARSHTSSDILTEV